MYKFRVDGVVTAVYFFSSWPTRHVSIFLFCYVAFQSLIDDLQCACVISGLCHVLFVFLPVQGKGLFSHVEHLYRTLVCLKCGNV